MAGKKKQLEPPHDPMPNMTAMVDLVMCILIFFMMGSKFLKPETFLSSSMPVSLGFGSQTVSNDVETPLMIDLQRGAFGVVVVMPAGNRSMQITPPSDRKEKESEYLDQLDEYMEKVTAELSKRRADLGRDVRLVLKPDPQLEYKYIAGVFNACQKAKNSDGTVAFKDISFAMSLGGK